jgi:catechol 2,3-dioxygenase-like lactoylglutathione lyase family enzyme
MTTPRLDHVSITTADLVRSIAFYRDVLGLELTATGEAAEPELSDLVGLAGVRVRYAELSLGRTQILELLEYETPTDVPLDIRPNRPGATHLAFAVPDLIPVKARLDAANATVSKDVVTLTEEGEWNGVRTLYARDPDGVTIELVERAPTVIELPEDEPHPASRPTD